MKTGEMYMLNVVNPNAKFMRVMDQTQHKFVKGYLVDQENFAVSPNPRSDEDWELVREPVDFMTAINSGENIISEFWKAGEHLNSDIPRDDFFRVSADEINGKWYIE